MDRQTEEEITPLISRHGIPTSVRDNRQTYQKQLAVYLILASTLFERIAYYALAGTLAITADPDRCPSSKGPVATLIFTGTSNISALLFAIISDWKLGRAKTIIVGFVLYLIGYIIAIISTSVKGETCTGEKMFYDETCASWILPALVIIAIGSGATQSNLAVFGAEQVQEEKFTARFFDKHVLAINIGAIFAKVIYFAFQSFNKPYGIPYIFGASALLIAVLLFLIGYRYYIHVKSNETIITKCIPVVINAFQTWREHRKNKTSEAKKQKISISSNVMYTSRTISDDDESTRIDLQIPTFLDYAKATNHGKFIDRIVDDVKSFRGSLAVFSLLIPYWLIYDQSNSTFRLQAKHMRETNDVRMAAVSILDPAVIIVGLLILNIFVYKYLEKQQKFFTIATKFLIGMCFAVITMCIAGSVEKVRRDNWTPNTIESNMTIYNQIPQVLSMGVSELFVMVASFEFAYFSAPRSGQSFFTSLRFFTIGLSSFIGSGYIAAFETNSSPLDFSCRTEPDPDRWRYYTYFYILAGVQFIFILIFFGCQKKFEIIKLNRQHLEKGRFLQHSPFSASRRE